MKFDFETAVDQQTRARDRTLWVFRILNARATAAPIFDQFLAQFCQITFLNSTPKLKVEIKLYVDSESFMKKILI